jgi:membrane protein YqaA with SNARE-associated domain
MFSVLLGLFTVSFLSATLLPGTSEAALSGILATNTAPLTLAVAIATIGNTLGACVNWAMGRFFSHYREKNWFPLKPQQFARYQNWYQKWGLWSLLLSWMPVIGDPLTAIAGLARTSLWVFIPIVFVAKAARYAVVAGIVSQIF